MAWDKKKLTWAYVAGFMDGEGMICHTVTSQGSNRFRVVFAQLTENSEVLYAIAQFLGRHEIPSIVRVDNSRVGTSRNPRSMSYLEIGKAQHVYRFLKAVQPYAFVKSDEIEFCISGIDERREWAKCNKGRRGTYAYLGW